MGYHRAVRPRPSESYHAITSLLEGRGWKILSESREGGGAEPSAEYRVLFGETEGRVVARHLAPGKEERPAPVFLRVDLGEPGDPPASWRLFTDDADFGDGDKTWIGIQGARGAGWASSAAVTSGEELGLDHYLDKVRIDKLAAYVEERSPGRPDAPPDQRPGQVVEPPIEHDELRWNLLTLFGASLLVLLPVVLLIWIFRGPEQGAKAVWATLAFLAAGVLFFWLRRVWRSHRARSLPERELASATIRQLRTARCIGRLKLQQDASLRRLPVLLGSPEGLRTSLVDVFAYTVSARVKGRGGRKGRLWVQILGWEPPEGALPESILVPRLWATVHVEGPESLLAALPEAPNRRRSDERASYTFTGEGIRKGSLRRIVADLLFLSEVASR